MEMRTLTVKNYGSTADLDTQVTIAPADVRLVIVNSVPVSVQGMDLKKVTIIFSDGFAFEGVLNDFDTSAIENTIGGYSYPI